MAAFPGGSNALKTQRDLLRDQIKKLQVAIAVAGDWVEALERDRIPLLAGAEAAYDASLLPTATAFVSQLSLETSAASTALVQRIKTTLSIQS